MNIPSEIYLFFLEYMWSVTSGQINPMFHLLAHSGNDFEVYGNLMDIYKLSGKLYT
jgi:hypothetical protein